MRKVKNPKMCHTRWTSEMDAQLKALWGTRSAQAVAYALSLSGPRVRLRAVKLGLSYPGIKQIYQPPRRAWIEIATRRALEAKLAPKDVIQGCRLKAVARVRWAAFQEVLDRYPICSVAGLARLTGFDHTGILHGLRRNAGQTALEARYGRAIGRRPQFHPPVPPEVAAHG
jgi:hypothetical protein